MTDPAVTVLMAVHNGAAFVAEAVRSTLAQTWRDFELLVIDDGSSDGSAAIVEAAGDPRIRLLRNERNLGLTSSLNRGLREARGELIARLDADDVSHPERLERQVRFLHEHPDVALVGAQGWTMDAQGRRVGRRDVPLEPECVRWASSFVNPLLHSAVMFRRSVFWEELGGYDEAFTCCQDYELWTRALAKHRLANLRERLVSFREHAQSVSVTRRDAAALLTRQALERLLRGQLSEDQVGLLARFRAGIEPEERGRMHEIFRALTESVVTRRTRALLFAQMGYGLLAQAPIAGLCELVRAVAVSPGYGLSLPWWKIAGLALLGERARRIYQAMTGSSARG